MAHNQPGPALPWAATADAPSSQNQAAIDQEGSELRARSAEQLGLQIGARIEVKWQVEPEGDQPFSRWWGASIVQPQDPPTMSGTKAAAAAGTPSGPVYHLKYDAFGDDFDEEEVAVQLLSDHLLLDVGQHEVMTWRAEGDPYEPPESEEEEEEEAMELGEGPVVSLRQLAASITDADVAAADGDIMSRLAGCNPSEQVQLAAGYRDFMENFKAFLASKAASAPASGDGVLITTADVADFKAMMQTRSQQR